jgi:4-amino-4-deoxy-L-arabinose transferase-like glycosyltransferase
MNLFLTFSDSAKFADIARNLVSGLGYGNNFRFWSSSLSDISKYNIFPALSVPPVMPFSIATFFKIFGVSDFAVIATSFFYFLLTLIFVFLLAKKVTNNTLASVLSTLAVGFNQDLINYATSGASESPFIFEIVAALYFVSLKKKWGNVLAFVFLILLYFTRPQAFIYIAGIVLFWLLINFKTKTALIYFVIISVVGFLVDKFILGYLAGRYFLYSFTGRGVDVATRITSGSSTSDSLRGITTASNGLVAILKKVFYNLYNFFKLLPQIMSPYLFGLFIVGSFKSEKNKIQNSFRVATVFMTVVTFLVTATSIPFFRYIHPIVPLIYIVAAGILVEIISGFQFPVFKRTLFVGVSTFLILVFGVGQTLGVLILDSRFEKDTHNIGKPPVYVELGKILNTNTNSSDLVVTNLDTWGSWYGERKTVWFPLEPKQLIDSATGRIPFDVIYLTSYKIDDENYYMSKNWRMIFDNPSNPKKWTCDGCAEIANEFMLKDIYKISAGDNYERQDASSILLVRKH